MSAAECCVELIEHLFMLKIHDSCAAPLALSCPYLCSRPCGKHFMTMSCCSDQCYLHLVLAIYVIDVVGNLLMMTYCFRSG